MAVMDAIRAAVAQMGPYPHPARLLPRSPHVELVRGRIVDVKAHVQFIREQRAGMHQPPAKPCSNPRERGTGMAPICICGHHMGAHNKGDAT